MQNLMNYSRCHGLGDLKQLGKEKEKKKHGSIVELLEGHQKRTNFEANFKWFRNFLRLEARKAGLERHMKRFKLKNPSGTTCRTPRRTRKYHMIQHNRNEKTLRSNFKQVAHSWE